MYGGHARVQIRILRSDGFEAHLRYAVLLERKLQSVCGIDAQDVRLLVIKWESI
jgi:hypothetical protein